MHCQSAGDGQDHNVPIKEVRVSLRRARVMNHKCSLYSRDYTLTRSRSCRQRLSRFVTQSCQKTAVHAPISSVFLHRQTNPIKKTAASQTAGGRATIRTRNANAISAECKQTQVISIQMFIRPQHPDDFAACLLHTRLSANLRGVIFFVICSNLIFKLLTVLFLNGLINLMSACMHAVLSKQGCWVIAHLRLFDCFFTT